MCPICATTLLCYLMCMVIYILVYIERFKGIQTISVFKLMKNRTSTCNTHEMCSMKNGVQMNDWHYMIFLSIKIWLHNPHVSVWTCLITNCRQPCQQSAQISDGVMFDLEKQFNLSCMQPTKAW